MATAIALTACACASHAPVAVYEEPHHQLVYQNGLVRILNIVVPPGSVSRYHVHAQPLISITVQDARSWSQDFGKAPGPIEPAGNVPSVGDNWERVLPYTHRVANVDSVPYHRVAAEWLGSAGLECARLPDMPGVQLVKDARFGRVYEIRVPPHGSIESHVHSCPGLTVQGSSGALRVDGTAPAAHGGNDAGSWSWREAGSAHAIHNDGDTPAIVYEVDWR